MRIDAGSESTRTRGRIGRLTTLLLVVAMLVAAPTVSAAMAGAPADGPVEGAAPPVEDGNATAETANATNGTAETGQPGPEFWSAPPSTTPQTKTQPDGTTFEARLWGSARQHGWETTDGYTVVRPNESGWWYYATVEDGALVATDRRAGVETPDGLSREVRPVTSEPQRVSSTDSTTDDGPALAAAADAGRTDVPIPILFANFEDTEPEYSADSFADLYFGSDPEEATGPGSFREYFLEASDGRVNFTAGPGVVGWFDTSMTHDEAGESAGKYAVEAIQTADDTTDFSKYDHDDDGTVRVALIHPGPGAEVTGDETDIWSHRATFLSPVQTDDGVDVTGYSVQPAKNRYGQQNTIGVMAHETGHLMYDWPDLYEGTNISRLGLMGKGNYGEINRPGDSPVHPIAWTKEEVGWATTTRIAPTNQSGILPASSQVNDFYQVGATGGSGHHYLLSYRALDGFDRGLKSQGNRPGLYAWKTDNDGVSSGTDINHTYLPGDGGAFTADGCSDCQSGVALQNVTTAHDAVLFNDPPNRTLDAGESAVYAVPVNTTLPDGRTVGDDWLLSARATWADTDHDLDITLTGPDGAPTLTSDETETSYEGVRSAETPGSGGWKLTETATDGGVDYYSATTYPTLPLPTALTVAADSLEAGPAATPDPVTTNVTVRTGDQRYATGAFDALSASEFTVLVGPERVPDEDVSVAREGPGVYAVTVTPPTKDSGGTYELAVNVTDAKAGVNHTTNTSTAAVVYDSEQNAAPTAVASANRTTVTVGQAVEFNASGSTDSDGSVASYEWAFGDGATATSAKSVHAFDSNGTYTATVTVTDDDGATATDTVTVEVRKPNAAPTADAAANRTTVTTGQAVEFNASESADSDGSVASYEWAFGDGDTTTGVEPVHTFDSNGTYTATVTVTDDDGATATDTVTVEVNEPNAAPTVVASANRTSVTAGQAVAFNASASTDSDGSVDSYEWAFGDGENATGAQPVYAFDSNGTYTATVTVTDDDGANNSTTLSIEVTESGNGNNGDDDSGGNNGDDDSGGNNGDDDSGGNNGDDDSGGNNGDDDSGGNNGDDDSGGSSSGGSSSGGSSSGGSSGGLDTGDTDETSENDSAVTLAVDDPAPTTGETVNVTVNISDAASDSGQRTVVWRAGNRTIDRSTVEMATDSSGTVTLSRSFSQPGNYRVSLENSTSATIAVDGPSESRVAEQAAGPTATPSPTAANATTGTAGTGTGTTGGGGPGFGVVVALVAVLAVVWHRRRPGADR